MKIGQSICNATLFTLPAVRRGLIMVAAIKVAKIALAINSPFAPIGVICGATIAIGCLINQVSILAHIFRENFKFEEQGFGYRLNDRKIIPLDTGVM